jgi:hypothetical protein
LKSSIDFRTLRRWRFTSIPSLSWRSLEYQKHLKIYTGFEGLQPYNFQRIRGFILITHIPGILKCFLKHLFVVVSFFW